MEIGENRMRVMVQSAGHLGQALKYASKFFFGDLKFKASVIPWLKR
jgi:hypothetical protein